MDGYLNIINQDTEVTDKNMVPKSLEKFYLMLLYIIGIAEVALMTLSVVKIEVIEKIWVLNLSMTVLFLLIIFIFARFVALTATKTAHNTNDYYSSSQYAMYKIFHKTIQDVSEDYKLINKMLTNGEYTEVADYLNNTVSLDMGQNFVQEVSNPAISYLLNAKIQEARLKGVSMTYHISSQTQLRRLPAKDLTTIFGNLLDNAIRAATESEIKQVKLSWLQDRKNETLVVENYSAKDIAESVPHLFEWGFTTKADGKGGDGLPIVKKLVVKHGGKISVETNDTLVRFIVHLQNP